MSTPWNTSPAESNINTGSDEKHIDLQNAISEADKIQSVLKKKIEVLEDALREADNNKASKILKGINKIKFIWNTAGGGGSFFNRFFFFFTPLGFRLVSKLVKGVINYILRKKADQKQEVQNGDRYQQWVSVNFPDNSKLDNFRKKQENFEYKPFFTLVCVAETCNGFKELPVLKSLYDQVYTNWELIILHPELPGFTDENLVDSRVRFVGNENNLDTILRLVKGEFVFFAESTDALAPHALYSFAELLNTQQDADVIYTDEDRFAGALFSFPSFKPDWCPDTLLSVNYLGNAVMYRTNLLRSIGLQGEYGHPGFCYDLNLRVTEMSARIFHLSDVLLHKNTGSTYTLADHYADLVKLRQALERREEDATVESVDSGRFSVRYTIKEYRKVSVIIPTKDKADILEKCLQSIIEKTTYPEYEIIVLDNNSNEEVTFELFRKYQQLHSKQFKVVRLEEPFNYSRINNYAVAQSEGDYLLFLNNDTEVLHSDWMELMVQQAQRKSIGAIGVKLLFPNRKIQHAGMVIGLEYGGNTFLFENELSDGYLGYINIPRNYSAVTAACLICRREVFDQVGGFDEEFAVEYNDSDLCLKIKEAGYNNIYLPHVMLLHYESLSRGYVHVSKKSYERHLKDKEKYSARWAAYLQHDPCYNKNLSKEKAGFEILKL